MNKNLLFSLVGATALIGFSACQNDDLLGDVAAGQQTTVTFSAQLPGAVTRAYGDDAAYTNKLQYIVYSGETIAVEGTAEITPGVATNVQVDLVSGQAYEIYFWADKGEGSPYTFSGKQVSIDYTGAANDAERDAFFAKKSFTASATTEAVTLTRPFAQLNIGTSDIAVAAKTGFSISTVTVATTAYSTIDLSGDALIGSDETAVEFTAAVPADGQAFPISGYDYLAMDYLFQTDAEDVVITITPDNGTEIVRTVASVPFKTNYRTNIAGKLLTQSQGFEVTIDQIFAEPSTDISVWDGTSQEPASYNEETNTYEIATGSQLAWFAAAVNGTLDAQTRADIDYTKADFTLTSNVDLGGNEWTPIGTSANPYKGTFNGGGYTISNLVVDMPGVNYVGLFGYTTNGEISNLTVHNAKVVGRLGVGAVAGCPYTSDYSNITVSGDVYIDGMAYVGGAFGRNAYADLTNITINANEGSYVKANSIENGTAYASYVGGVVGFMGENGHTVSNATSNIDVIGNVCYAGGISGIAHYGNTFINCKSSGNVTIIDEANNGEAFYIGGIAGTWNNGSADENVTISGCEYTGTLTATGITEFDYLGLVGRDFRPDEAKGNKLILEYNLATAQQLQLLAKDVNNGNSYAGKTINLVADVDLNNEAWEPIGNADNTFKGHFDGGNHTISNLNIEKAGKNYVGFFGYTTTGSVKNLTFDNATVVGRLGVGVVAGCPYTTSYNNITVKGDIKVDGKFYVGGMFGRNLYASASNLTIKVNEGSYVKADSNEDGVAYRAYIGGVVGFMGEGSNIVVKNVYSNINVEGTVADVGGLTGIAHYGNTFENCTVEANVTITEACELTGTKGIGYTEIGGIAGVWHNNDDHKVTFTKCVFNGTLASTDLNGVSYDELVNAKHTIAGSKYDPEGQGQLFIDGVEVTE